MRIAISVPSGAHHRTLLLPLKRFFEQDADIEKVNVITPAAKWRQEIFPGYGNKFEFTDNPKVQADIVVTTTSGLDPNDPAILQAAKEANIPTLTFIESWDNIFKMERFHQQAKPQVIADHLIVWNTMMRDHLLRIFPDLTSEHISIIGAPRLDYFSHTDKIPTREQLFHYLDLNDTSKKLIHLSTTELYPIDYVAKAIHKAIASTKIKHQVHFYASVHPGGNIQNHAKLKDYGAIVRYSFGRRDSAPHPDFLYNPTEEELYMLVALFKHSNLLINHSSTTAIESMLADVPIINVQYGRPFDFFRWRKSPVYRDFQEHYADILSGGATTVVHTQQALIAAVNQYLAHPELHRAERAKTLKKMITTVDGTASGKVHRQIKQQAKTYDRLKS